MTHHEPAKITLVGVIVICLIVVVGAIIVVTVLPFGRTHGPHPMSRCGANLNAIGKGIQIYLAENDAFPLLHTEGDLMAPLDASTDSDDITALNSNAMQIAWIMIQSGSLQEEHFKCPADKDWKARNDIESGIALKKYGWNDVRNFGFGIHKPYGPEHASPLNDPERTPQESFVIFADKNHQADGKPGPVYYTSKSDFRKPGNHPRDGVNYLTYGASAGRARYRSRAGDRASACGTAGDDIYVAQDAGGTLPGTTDPTADSTSNTDTFILPWQAGNP